LSGEKSHFEGEYLTVTGNVTTYMNANFSPSFSADGSVSGVIGIFEDISERKKAEEELQENRQRLQAFYDATFEGIVITHKGRIIEANESLSTMFGYRTAELLDMAATDLVAPELRKWVQEKILSAHEQPYESTCLKKDGTTFPVEVCGKMYAYKGQQVRVTAVRDISERKPAEKHLQQSNQRLQAIIDSIDAVVFVTDMKTHEILMINQYGRDIYGDFKEQKCWEYFQADQKGPCDFCANAELISSDGKLLGTHTREVQSKVNGRWYDCRDKAIQWVDGRIVRIEIATDITERKRAETNSIKLDKLESMAVLGGGIAHDFNNLLAVICASIDLALDDLDPNHPARGSLDYAFKAAFQGRDLTNMFQTFAKGGEPERKTTSMKKILEDSANLALSGSNVVCKFSIQKDLWPGDVDQALIGQVFNNVIFNAKDAMPQGGTLQISAENREGHEVEDPLFLPAKKNPFVKISFMDSGVGIDAANLLKIFDPYFSNKEKSQQKGMGLGLSIVSSIVEKHNGHVAVRSEPGVGTNFDIYLPAAVQQQSISTADCSDSAKSKKKRVLFMDDEEAMRELIKQTLSRLNCDVALTSRGEDAIELYGAAMQENKPFDLVFLDLTVKGGMGGRETIRQLLAIDPDVTAVVCSGYTEDPAMTHFAEYGFVGALAKPFLKNDLQKILEITLPD
jgi:PAS domain S-box-containing protein